MRNSRTAGYCRLALASNSEILEQVERVQTFAAQNGYSDIIYYTDNGYSGNNLSRPAISKLSEDIGDGLIDTVIVLSLDRIARGEYLAEEWCNSLEKHKVKLVFVYPPLNIMKEFANIFSQIDIYTT